ncbi:MAG TPA: DUF1460 domain-containing protein [Algoriphagus sp.]|jgi:hypothetical protein|uniref:N-acetylmuramoyl-L-alanine amidase-like domain-containing protein n=1 Tax=unclassified Algoriphagus TaxID=2641541 RepID=UPI000C494471|nr:MULTISPECIES: N-acetylmuramoyl-L-alanine amidase-like domain-containing protein [unclassified Algoriphagus]MAL15340.1 cytosolic protein [Algoriphagus sp.]MAN85877.1 cytosolic protein [Algoriphagus sp.]QYH39473.1 DUF1460 domain-containing protein [Algoriphagus sp. NBT04N3]HAS58875.1 DUF1460 domain-containing protein [Algoriphagus sp.]HCD89542.1 DUF1460 domain-containing protein [Algoriphagus sp.]|tara:strand:- start:1867 stop:2715 length:849 start_codon:yes stop_codon:yes gene_type:complete
MKRFFILFFILSFELSAQTVCDLQSREKLESTLENLSQENNPNNPIHLQAIEIGQSFLKTPYVEKTLEVPGPEQLVINLMGVDCTTFVETVLGLTRISQMGKFSMKNFEEELEKIRYRQGENKGYTSRLHYFSDWIYDNEQKGIVMDMTQAIGGISYTNKPSFMTENPQFYPQLSQKANVDQLRLIESAIAKRSYYFIPKDQIHSVEEKIQSGDIIAITTTIPNLDMVHVGFAIEKNGRIHLLHASSKNKEVEISALPLHDYLQGNRTQSGIMVGRLVELSK